jgi:hypothetical protein
VSTDREYLTAAIPEAVQVFGILLRPFSLGHHLILSRFESPIVCGGEAGIDDVLFAVWVCGHTYEDAIERLATGYVAHEIKRWRRIMRRRQWYGLRPLAFSQFIEKTKLLREHVESACKIPNLFSSEGGKGVGSPTMQVLRVTLQRELHLSDTEILNRPLSQCWWDLATLAELRGKGKVIDRDEFRDMQRKADEFHEKFMAERRQ